MTIKRRDGSDYRLSGPNPLTEEQERWDSNSLIFHNFDQWEEKVVEGGEEVLPRYSRVILPQDESFSTIEEESLPEPGPVRELDPKPEPEPEPEFDPEPKLKRKPELKLEMPEPEPEPEEESELDFDDLKRHLKEMREQIKEAAKSRPKNELKNKVVMYCLPAVVKTIRDTLYNNVTQQVNYNKKFTFEAVVIEREDLIFGFWTTVEISEQSIIFPISYANGDTFGEFRWWKVQFVRQVQRGYLYSCISSGKTPDFSR